MFRDDVKGFGKLKKCPQRLARFLLAQAAFAVVQLHRDRRAVTALEYAIVGPVFLLFLFAAFGVGLAGFYQLALDDAVRDASRQIQIYGPAATSKSNFVSVVCQTFGYLASDCATSVTYNVQASTAAAGFAGLSPATLNPSGQFGNAFFATSTPYAPGVNVLVQVSYPLPFTLPYVGALITFTGANSVVSTATVRVEPYG